MKCYHCKGDHPTVDDVRYCAGFARKNAERRVTDADRPPTEKQLIYIKDLELKKGFKGQIKTIQSLAHASRVIQYLKKQPDMADANRPGAIVTYPIVNLIKDGRYAVTVGTGAEQQFVFFRISRPKGSSRLRDHLQVQTQHSDTWTRRLLYGPTGNLVYQNNRPIAGAALPELIALIVRDPYQAAYDYANQLGECGRCGKKLTDERSRHFGIGPDCEKKWVAHVNWVRDHRGDFSHA